MKIAHIVDSMEVGGAETLVAQMCRLQRKLGHEPCVYAVASLGALGERLRQEGFTVGANIGRHLPDATRNFYCIFRASRPDVVHLHNPTPAIYAAIAARLAGVPRIVSTRHSLVGPPHKWVQELKYALAARFCDSIVGICDATVNNLRSLHTIPGHKLVRVYNGAEPIQRVPQEKCPPKDGFTLLFVGRLAPVKNLPFLLRAFQIALASRSDLRLWIVGDGSERSALEKLAQELNIDRAVKFWGQQIDVGPFFSTADAFIMSSKSEGLPMSLLQAFSLGLPAIVTDVGGMAEVVRLSSAGLTVPPNHPDQMAAAIVSLATNPEERAKQATNAAKAYASHFTLEAMAATYVDLYETKTAPTLGISD